MRKADAEAKIREEERVDQNAAEDTDKKGDNEGNNENQSEDQPPANWLEKAATLLSALIVAGLIGVLLHDATQEHSPPSFTVTTGKPNIVNDSYRLPVHVLNTGDKAGRGVIVHVELVGRDSVLAETDLNIDWLAGHETHDAFGYFKRPAVPHRFRAEVRGYTEP